MNMVQEKEFLNSLKENLKDLNNLFYDLKEGDDSDVLKYAFLALLQENFSILNRMFKVEIVNGLLKIDELDPISIKRLSTSVIEGEKLLKEIAHENEIGYFLKLLKNSKPSDIYEILMSIYIFNNTPSELKRHFHAS